LSGFKVNLAFTSPPYASQRKYDESSGFKPIPPDDYVAWFDAVQANVREYLAPDGSWFVNIKEHCDDGQRSLYVKDLTIAHVRKWGWLLVDEFCWVRKGVPGGWEYRFKNEWEPVFHFAAAAPKCNRYAVGVESDQCFDVKNRKNKASASVFDCNAENGKVMKSGLALPGNVLTVNGQTESEHNAGFPVGLPSWFVRAFSDPGDLVYEPFMGSGTTMIASAKEGRVCRGIEISPMYCDVIRRRWTKWAKEHGKPVGSGGLD
jgi:DNA modification methylase